MPCSASLVKFLYKSDLIWGSNPPEKPLRSSQKSNFLLLQIPFKIYNFITTNAILMKLTTIMYLNDTFYLTKNWGVTHRA